MPIYHHPSNTKPGMNPHLKFLLQVVIFGLITVGLAIGGSFLWVYMQGRYYQ